ncbi:MAG: tetratricopeptide repeat protein [Erythrobacter sp.]
MTSPFRTLSRSSFASLLAAAVVVTTPVPAMAQDSASETRIRKLEAEVRALQRKVFPGGDTRFFEPEIQPGSESAAPQASAAPAVSAITDVLARLDALENQMQRLTALSEEQANSMSQLERRLSALEGATSSDSYTGPPPIDRSASAASTAGGQAGSSATTGNLAAMAGSAPAAASTAAPNAARLAAVQAIAKPQTGDAGDDEYSYGFRLWDAGFFPEARQQLLKFVEDYPNHSRISFGRNLLGRAFLDDKMPEDASRWFLRNYNADKNGARAPDSLFYLARAMIAMNDTRRACIALAEFGDTYPAVATGRLASEYEATRRAIRCN